MAIEKFTPEKIRSELIKPLRELIDKLETAATDLEDLYQDGKIQKPWLPVNIGGKTSGAVSAIANLKHFFKKEISLKLDQVREGTLRYREMELRIGKKSGSPKSE